MKIMKIINMSGAFLIPSGGDPNKMYLEHGAIRYIFENGIYAGWYRPELDRVV